MIVAVIEVEALVEDEISHSFQTALNSAVDGTNPGRSPQAVSHFAGELLSTSHLFNLFRPSRLSSDARPSLSLNPTESRIEDPPTRESQDK